MSVRYEREETPTGPIYSYVREPNGCVEGYVPKHDVEVRWKEWRRQVDLEVQKRVGLSADDLEDMPYRDWFDSGMKPASAACKAIKRAGAF